MALTPDHMLWAYRLLLDRDPESEEQLAGSANFASTKDLRAYIMDSGEYLAVNPRDQFLMSHVKVWAELAPYGCPGRLLVNLSDGIGRTVASGGYEPEEIAFVNANVKPGQTVVDVGANIGLFSVLASHLVSESGKVFAYEALPENAALINRSLAENPVCRNVTIAQVLVTDRPRDDMELAYHELAKQDTTSPFAHSGGSFLISRGAPLPTHMSRLPIPGVPLDDLVPAGQTVDFIKIDIEGAEPLAMRGAERILTTQSPLIMSEVHTTQLPVVSQTDWRGYFELMRGYGYRPRYFESGVLGAEPQELEDGIVYNIAFVKTPA